MKTFLMFRDRDFSTKVGLAVNEDALRTDLELDVLFEGMARGDKVILEAARSAVLASLSDPGEVTYRQGVLKDCLKNASTVRGIYTLAVEAVEGEQQQWIWYDKSPDSILRRAVKVLYFFTQKLKLLRTVADQTSGSFESEGFRTFFSRLKEELTDEYIADIESHLREMSFSGGALVSAGLGPGNKGVNYTLRKKRGKEKGRLSKVLSGEATLRYKIDEGDEIGPRLLKEMKERGINTTANALARSCDHVQDYFTALRIELAFYVGCLNLQERLAAKGQPACFPTVVASGGRALWFENLYDACLALKTEGKVVGNDADARGKDLVLITGANRGGKSTFLRSIGLAQLLTQCGAFVPATSFSSDVSTGLFTHFKREEDSSMKSGKLDEELKRMSEIVDHLTPNCEVLLNESFSATNEVEGSEISRQIVTALLERKVKVLFVTHQYEFAHGMYEGKRPDVLFMRAERKPGGERTFKVLPGEPLETSYGEDLYVKVFAPKTNP